MKLHRRGLLALAAGALAAPNAPRMAIAQSYPARPVYLIVGFAAGGATDIIARLIGQCLSERLGRQVIIENRPGASTNLATQAVARGAPDGYTLLVIGPPAAINATLYTNLNFNFVRDIAPVAALVRVPFVIVVEKSFPATTMAEFIAYARAKRGKISMATPGNATGPEMAGELFKMMTGIDMLTVRYRGDAPALTDLMGGQVDVYFAALPPALEFIRAGRLRPLAVTTATRSDVLPEVPTVGELLPGFEASWLSGIGAPRSTPAEIVERLNSEANACLATSFMRERLAKLGAVPLPLTAAEYNKLMVDEIEKWGAVIRAANIRPE
jgi:tripartite-type tricarboxylate transporter receptor subunit TctC